MRENNDNLIRYRTESNIEIYLFRAKYLFTYFLLNQVLAHQSQLQNEHPESVVFSKAFYEVWKQLLG